MTINISDKIDITIRDKVLDMANQVMDGIYKHCLNCYCLHETHLVITQDKKIETTFFVFYIENSNHRFLELAITKPIFTDGVNTIGVTFESFVFYIICSYLLTWNLINIKEFNELAQVYGFFRYRRMT